MTQIAILPKNESGVTAVATISAIVPVFNKASVLRQSLDSIVAAARADGAVEVILIDHASTDGSSDILREYVDDGRILEYAGGTISSVRNFGAQSSRGDVISFLDSDCVVDPDYFHEVRDAFRRSQATAVGCEYELPRDPHWSEATWHRLRTVDADGYRNYINAGNFAIGRDAFHAIGGFNEELSAGEDSDFCRRLRDAGYQVYEDRRVRAVHLGNPKTLGDFYRKQVWHGAGVLRGHAMPFRDRATTMILGHLLATIGAVAVLVVPSSLGIAWRSAIALALVLAAPFVNVLFRYAATRRITDPLGAMTLFTAWYFARAFAMAHVLVTSLRPGASGRA